MNSPDGGLHWSDSFKSDVQSSGAKLYAQEKVSIPSGGDTTIHAYVRGAPAAHVTFFADDIASPVFTAACNCPAGKKGRLCKHAWAALLAVEAKYPDFLSDKRQVEVAEPDSSELDADALAAASAAASSTASSLSKPVRDATSVAETAAAKSDYAAEAKRRAADYRKEQYARQKDYAKKVRDSNKPRKSSSLRSMPADVTEACAYFALNGFPMEGRPSEEIVGEAKRKLSRLFHPDKGGTHAEMIELNRNVELVLGYLNG